MKITKSRLRRLVKEELEKELRQEGVMDFFRSKDTVDVAFRKVEEYLEETSQKAYETAKAVLSQNIKKQNSSSKKNIGKMQDMIEPVQVKFSTGDRSGQEVKALAVSLKTDKKGSGAGDFMKLTFAFEFNFNATEVGENRYEVQFYSTGDLSSGDNVLLPRDLGSQLSSMMNDEFGGIGESGGLKKFTVDGKDLMPLLMSRARYIIEVLPALYRFAMAESYIDYRYDWDQSAEDVFNQILKPSYEEIQSKQPRSKSGGAYELGDL